MLAASLAPLLVLWGLEQGVVGTMIDRLERDPVMRQLLPDGAPARRFDEAWFGQVRRWPGVEFAMPNTRAIANQVDLFAEGADTPLKVDLLPTAAGDPLLAGSALPPPGTVMLGALAARRLKVEAGARVTLALERQREGRGEHAAVSLTVAGVLPEVRSERPEALAPMALLETVQAWRDGYTVPAWHAEGNGPSPQVADHPLFRIYARSIRDVRGLAMKMEADGIPVFTRAREIESTLGLQRNLRAILAVTAAVVVTGAVAAVAALQIASLRRKRREHALLKLTGHGSKWLVGVASLGALGVATLGLLLSFAAYGVMAAFINQRFAPDFAAAESTMRLDVASAALAVAGTVLVAVLPAAWGGWRASRVDAADELRES
ncbi:MAG: hypothetical protein L6Q68_08825 [Aquabacterium sp.]|nr:hypothetical protein [Aquabacterium sp.]